MSLVEIFGLVMSAVIALSLTQKSILKLRIINIFGSIGFIIYGALIGSYPVITLNTFTTFVNLWHLGKLLQANDQFGVLTPGAGETTFLDHFLAFNKDDIKQLYPDLDIKALTQNPSNQHFPIVRNGLLVSLVSCHKIAEDHWQVLLDYAIPSYRDLKCGRYFYSRINELLKEHDTNRGKITTRTESTPHIKYLKKLGYVHDREDSYSLRLHSTSS